MVMTHNYIVGRVFVTIFWLLLWTIVIPLTLGVTFGVLGLWLAVICAIPGFLLTALLIWMNPPQTT